MKPASWVVDLRHYLDEETGDLPEAIPERVLTLAVFFGAIVAWVTRPPAAGRLADERALPALPWSPALPRRDRR